MLRHVRATPNTRGSARLLRAGMPKKAGATTKGKSQSKEPERPLPPLGPVAVDPKGCVTIAIHAKPGSKQNAVTDLTAEAVNVAIAAPPSEGEANAELCRYLSKVLELRKSDVVLDKTGSCYIAQAGLQLLASSDLPASASQSAGITGVSHHTQPALLLISL
ncbi:C15orf40 isoform 5 [Pongo abelii]|uniref:C15orf40 isoform 5 n=1 Tax=Pongo abelii TaxID=9601 RepID=A0A2J8SGB4_PONAB|nr:C15orf40 isoform 5 [Pongo abelii]